MPLPRPSSDAKVLKNWAAMLGQVRQTYSAYLSRTADDGLTTHGAGSGFQNASIAHDILPLKCSWPLRVRLWCLVITFDVWSSPVAAQGRWAHHAASDAPVDHTAAVLTADLAALAQMHPQVFEPDRLVRWIGDRLGFSAQTAMRLLPEVPLIRIWLGNPHPCGAQRASSRLAAFPE